MQCAFCKEIIEDDSLYCDMCGEELKRCPSCKKMGKGKVCTSCGTPLSTIKSQMEVPSENEVSPDKNVHSGMGNSESKSSDNAGHTLRLPDEKTIKSEIPELHLLNKNINVDLKVDDNTIVGREAGQYISTFGKFGHVSGKHCRFNYDPTNGWSVTDLGSRHKTQYNNLVLIPNVPQLLDDKSFLKIANIEFFVRIMSK